MREAEVAVTFEPAGKTVHVLRDTRVIEATAGAGLVLDLPCGGEGVCGKCRVQFRRGAAQPTAAEERNLPAEQLQQGWRMACQSQITGDATIEVPPSSLLSSYHQILARTHTAEPSRVDPAVRKQYVELALPTRQDDRPDLLRLEQAIGPFSAGLELLRELPARLRRDRYCGTAVRCDGALVDWESGNTQSQTYGVAVDVGTTTLAAAILDLSTGRQIEVVARLNPQTRYGDDVLSRIAHAQKPGGLEQLRQAILEAVDEMIGQLSEQAQIDCRHIYEVVFSGNTTMQQLLCGIDPKSLGEMPFVPTIGRSLWIPAADLPLAVHPRGRAVVLPVIGGFVGGDTVAGILATDLDESPGPALLVDIGTNGEIVLCHAGQLSATSTAAGPAFEGARILHGMRGCVGAIEKVVVDGRLRSNVIGDVPPIGLCGSALIDVAAELLRHGVITPEGRLLSADQLPAGVPEDLVCRMTTHEGRGAFLLAPAEETGTGKPIVLTQRDIRELQLATGAIRAGIELLLRQAGLEPADLESVLVAGGFGNFIRRKNAQRIGLLPPAVPRHCIRYQGNTSLAGAQMVALSLEARGLAEELARRTKHVDLSCDPNFQAVFADSMIFPSEEGL